MSLFSIDSNVNHCNYWLYMNYMIIAMVMLLSGSSLQKMYKKKLKTEDAIVVVTYIISLMVSFFQNRLLYSMCVNSLN